MLYAHIMILPILVHQREPFLHSLEQLYVTSERLEILLAQADAALVSLVEHQFHIRKDIGGILTFGNDVAQRPEFGGSLPYRLDKPEFLHVAGRKSPVKVVNKRYYRFSFHLISPHILAVRPKYRHFSPHFVKKSWVRA